MKKDRQEHGDKESAEEDTVGSERWSRAQKQTGASRTVAVPWKFELVKYISSTSAPTTTSIVSEMGRTPDVCSLSAEHLHPRTGGRPPGRRVGATPFFQVAPDVQGEGFTALRPRAGSPFPWPPPPHGGVLSCEKREPPLSLC
uniref:Uncharacterized protein n=1 Tax=Rangifer tarandus platyrhynchus TaxID=3082113 RepID=A0ACB0EW47_RANTA|nr:unnamed protein product [Rangifer tarandus platyrhynchus]